MANHAIFALLRCRCDETDGTESILGERINVIKHVRGEQLHIAAVFTDICEEYVRVLVVLEDANRVEVW